MNCTLAPDRGALHSHAEALRRQDAQYWRLLGAVCILTTGGLAFAVTPLVDERVTRLWPWANTHVVLIVALSVCTTLLVAYVSAQRHKTLDLRRGVEELLAEVADREQRYAARLQALLNISHMMGSLTSLERLFEAITQTCRELFACEQASLMLLNDATRTLEIRAATGHHNEQAVRKATVKLGEGIAGWVAERKAPLILNGDTNPASYPDLELKDKSITAAMVVPIVLRDALVGVLNVSCRRPDARYSAEDLQALLVFAENAGTCIRHTEHVEWMRNALHDSTDALAKLRRDNRSRVV
jgi:transcriptional regulator with GAF, ATPase, and Fis domain